MTIQHVSTGDADPAFFGRTDESRQILDLASRAETGAGAGGVLLVGPAGIGKTGLVGHVARSLEGWQVLLGRCTDVGDEAAPLAPFAGMWRRLANEHEANELTALLGPARRPLAALCAALGPPPGDLPPGALYEATAAALDRLSSHRPTLLVMEDVHWADSASLSLLSYLVRGLDDQRLVVVATARNAAAEHHELRRLLGELGRSADVMRLELGPLGESAVRDLVASQAGPRADDVMIDRIALRSEGYPFHAVEMARAGGDQLPPTLRDALLTRVQALGEEVSSVLETASVAGRDVNPRLLEAVLGGTGLDATLRVAVDAQVLAPGEDGLLAFVHDLQRDAVRSLVLPHVARALHGKIAVALQADPSLAPPGQAAADLARHLDLAGDHAAAIDAHAAAARDARRLSFFDAAFQHLRRAAELDGGRILSRDERIDLLHQAVEDGWSSGLRAEAAVFQRELVDLHAQDAAAHVAALCRLGEVLRFAGLEGGPEAIEASYRRLVTARSEGIEVPATTVAWVLGRWATTGQGDRPLALLEEARSVAEASGDPNARAQAHAPTADWLQRHGELEAAVASWTVARDAAREAGNVWITGQAFNHLAEVHRLRGDPASATAVLEEAARWLAELDAPLLVLPFLRASIAEDWLLQGRWEEAARLLDGLARVPAQGRDLFRVLGLRAELDLVRGRSVAAERDLRRLREVEDALPTEVVQREAWLPALDAHLRGDLDRLRELTADLDPVAVGPPAHVGVLDVLALRLTHEVDLVLAGTATDEVDVAVRELQAATEACSRIVPGTLLRHHRALLAAECSRLDGPDPGLWRDLPAAPVPHLARDLVRRLRLAEALLATDRRDEAIEVLGDLRSDAESLGARWLVDAVDQLARRARLPVPGTTLEGGDLGLTSRELDVLRLVADGLTNRQIGESLFISPKTVSIHVSNLLGKLAVPNRTAAAARARELGVL